jgi:hypothetical protein
MIQTDTNREREIKRQIYRATQMKRLRGRDVDLGEMDK